MLKIKAQLKIKRPCVCNSKRKCICECVGLVGGCVGEGSERAAKEKQKKGRGRLLVETKKKREKNGWGKQRNHKNAGNSDSRVPFPPLPNSCHPTPRSGGTPTNHKANDKQN